MGKKILVRSTLTEVNARTRRTLGRDEKGKIVEIDAGHRQFMGGQCYMTMEEGAELVESPENLAHIDAGVPPPYYYPMGIPIPVDENYEGPLSPPLSGAGLIASNAQQAESAKRVGIEADRQIAQRIKEAAALAKSAPPQKAAPTAQKVDETPVSTDGLPIAGAPTLISNPDMVGNGDAFEGVPTFRDEKAAAARAK